MKVKVTSNGRIEKSVVIGDLHIPFHDKRAVELVLGFIKDLQPDKIYLNGDIIDCWEISDFSKPLSIKTRLVDELSQAVKFLKKLRDENPKAEIIYIFGNHEFRFERYISKNAKELFGLRGMTLEEQLDLDKFNIKAVNSHLRENFVKYGKLLIGHFNRVNKHSAYTAKNLLEDKGMSLIQAHTHRGGIHYKQDLGGLKVAIEGFCLCELKPKYLLSPNWQQGIVVITKDRKSDLFTPFPIPIVKNRLLYGRDLYYMIGDKKKKK